MTNAKRMLIFLIDQVLLRKAKITVLATQWNDSAVTVEA